MVALIRNVSPPRTNGKQYTEPGKKIIESIYSTRKLPAMLTAYANTISSRASESFASHTKEQNEVLAIRIS